MEKEDLDFCDYAVAFIDLLGQKAAMPGRHLPENKDEAIALVKKSVGRIVGTQKLFESFCNSYVSGESIYSRLPLAVQRQIPDMAPAEFKWQYFSDGLVVYVPLGSGLVASPVNGIRVLLLVTGMLCLVGLAAGAPIRAGIDVAWGVEYRPNELYGSAVAHAYRLESEVAKWPRVVVGEGMIGYLQHYSTSGGEDASSRFRREMAALCQGMLAMDIDENWIVDYLGDGYLRAAGREFDFSVVEKAKSFVNEQIVHWRMMEDKRLLERYETVKEYFSHFAS